MNAILIWITGLSGSGKTTIGKKVYKELKKEHSNTVFLDGDSFRDILGNDLGHDPADRLTNAMRIARMCRFLTEQNINVICSTMSLYKEVHEFNRLNIKNYHEIYIDVPINKLVERDSKGLYAKALKGDIKNVVGVDLSYDKPQNCDLIIDNSTENKLDEKTRIIMNLISKRNEDCNVK